MSTSDEKKEGVYYVVGSVRAVRGDNAWVQWLGYPEKRSCWRSVEEHLYTSAGKVDAEQASQLKGKLATVTVTKARSPVGGCRSNCHMCLTLRTPSPSLDPGYYNTSPTTS